MLKTIAQMRDLISSNVTSALDAASNPAKMLRQLQREIEASIITLEGERTKTRQQRKALAAALARNEAREADWGDKAKAAMDHDREDLARQALLAREDCRETIARLKDDIAKADDELAQIDEAVRELETKREDTRQQAMAQEAADGITLCGSSPRASKADAHLGRIAALEKRADFAAEYGAARRGSAEVDREIADMRRAGAVDAELAAMKLGANAAPPKSRKKAK